jgi:hypothetical protein
MNPLFGIDLAKGIGTAVLQRHCSLGGSYLPRLWADDAMKMVLLLLFLFRVL